MNNNNNINTNNNDNQETAHHDIHPVPLLTEKDKVNFMLAGRIHLMYKQQVVFLDVNNRNTRLLISAPQIERINVPMEMESGFIVMNINSDCIKATCMNGEYALHLRRRKHAVGDTAFSAYMKNMRTNRRVATCYLMRVDYDSLKLAKHNVQLKTKLSNTMSDTMSTTSETMSSCSSTEDLEALSPHRDESGHVIIGERKVSPIMAEATSADKDKNSENMYNNNSSSIEQKTKKKSIGHKIKSVRRKLVKRGKHLLHMKHNNNHHHSSIVEVR